MPGRGRVVLRDATDEEIAPPSPGVNFVLCMTPGIPFLVMNGRMGGSAFAVDVRLQSSRWLDLFEERGGTLHIEKVDLARLGGRVAVIRDQLRWRMGRLRGFGFQHQAWADGGN